MKKLRDSLMNGFATMGAIFIILILLSYLEKDPELLIENRIYFLVFFFVYTLFIFLIPKRLK